MNTYVKLQKQIADLQAEAARVLAADKAGKIAEVKAIIQTYALTAQEVFGRGGSWKAKSSARGRSDAPKYGDSSGNTWGGRGPRPQWLRDALSKGSMLEEFALQGKSATTESPAKSRRPTAKKAATGRKVSAGARKTASRKTGSKKAAVASGATSKTE
jgi:DNA-binding protein H-NS